MSEPNLRSRRLADRRMLSLAWASLLALLAIAVLLSARAELIHRAQATRSAEVQADILAASVSAALAFDDHTAMEEYVNALRVNPEVASAAVYDTAGQAVVAYHQAGARRAPQQLPAGGLGFARRHVTVIRPVVQQGARLGAVYLETRPESWMQIAGRHSGLGVLTLLAFLLMGVVTAAASQLQTRARLLAQANERLLAEMAARSEAEEALRQSQKMEALGRLTGGIAHDFNNLLQVVHGAFELIRRKPQDPKALTWAQNGLAAAERGASLTRQLLAFSRSQKLEMQTFVVAELIGEMRELLVRTLGPDIVLEMNLDQDRVPVTSDRTQLELAVLNLAINARDAMPDGGRLTVATRTRAIGPNDPVLEASDYVELSVADTGQGMSPEVAERAFEPFFTTKDVGRGTGLGLSQVYGVARQTGGGARIDSTPGLGTTVTLFLRRSTAAPVADEATAEDGPVLAPRQGCTVLVVDDEAAVRTLASDILELLGYRALQADSGAAALTMLETVSPDLLLFDYAMPDMNGAELARRARLLRPETPIVFASGYADTEAVEAALGGEAIILRKPFDMETLARTVGSLLRDPTQA